MMIILNVFFIKNILDIDALHTFINLKMIFNNKCFLKSYFCSIFLHYGLAFKKELLGLVKSNAFDNCGGLEYARGLKFWEPL